MLSRHIPKTMGGMAAFCKRRGAGWKLGTGSRKQETESWVQGAGIWKTAEGFCGASLSQWGQG